MKRELLVVLVVIGMAGVVAPLGAQETTPASEEGEAGGGVEDDVVRRSEEVTVESASRTAETLVDAPATLSVVTSKVLETTPAQNYADLLRTVPGMNAIQMSARDLNLTARQATSTLANTQLVTVDGRTVYLDFFNLVLWDFISLSSRNEIKQIEVVRGPVGVVWGANALTGVVNIITKSPRENEGFGFNLNAGLFNRDGGSRAADGDGYSFDGNFYFGDAPNETWSYRLSAGYYGADPYSRPEGLIPLACHPLGVTPCRDSEGDALPGGFPIGGASYPSDSEGLGNQFLNRGTSQPKFNIRVDQDLQSGGRITYEGGYAGTEGIIHTGIGPFRIESGSRMIHGRVDYQKGALRFGGFVNGVDATAPNLLQVDPETLGPVILAFKTQTYDLSFHNTSVFAGRHALSYGGGYRRNNFEITLTPEGDNRDEFGAYVQDEFFLEKFRLAAGVRVDKFGNLAKAFWSPRISVMFKPTPDQSIRATYNRAFRSPSYLNNFLDQDISYPEAVDLCEPIEGVPPGIDCPLAFLLDMQSPGLGGLVPREPFYLTINNFGNRNLVAEDIQAIELAYTANFGGRTLVSLSVYRNDTDENINFAELLPSSEFPEGLPGLEYYTPGNPAQGISAVTAQPVVIDPTLMAALPPDTFPWKIATYLNLGPLRNQGIEAGVQHQLNPQLSAYVNYSWQDTPKILSAASDQIVYPTAEVGIPAASRFNAGVAYNGQRFLGNVNVNYSGEALWTDVLTSQFHGFTDSYTMLNATIGWRFADGRATITLKGTNLTNEEILQHVYGDILRRSVVAELSFFTH
jgi:outer membrane receptor protein involved in Fe transport